MVWIRYFVGVAVLMAAVPNAHGSDLANSDEADGIATLLAAEGLDEALPEPEDQAHRALRWLLGRGFAHSQDPRTWLAVPALEPAQSPSEARWLDKIAQGWAQRYLGHDRLHAGANPRGVAFDIPLADHPRIDAWIEHFSGRGRKWFARWLARADRYLPIMKPILAAKGVPLDTVYLAMIESGFSAKAFSRAAASGYWQFIASTGRRYGLRSDTWVDERRDFEMATASAADYLNFLYRHFGDWHLAWAAYNAGEGRIRRALAKTGASTYWDLADLPRAISQETRHYVPKIIAAAIVAKDRERFGFGAVASLSALTWDKIAVSHPTDLRVLQRRLKIPLATLRELNPALRHDITPPGRSFFVRVPQGHGPTAVAWLEKNPPSRRLTYRQHRVQSGDNLHFIARRFGSTVAVLREFNGLRNPNLLRPGQTLIVPTLARASTSSRSGGAASRTIQRKPKLKHVVTAGDTLWRIARRYGVTVKRLKAWNQRRGNRIRIGEVLSIF